MLKYSLRGCDDWRREGLPIRSTCSSEATKLYDCALNQLCGWYDDPLYGGLGNTLSDMEKADPDFILGQSLGLGLEFQMLDVAQETRDKYQRLRALVDKNAGAYEDREIQHLDAVGCLATGDHMGAVRVWERILALHPTDMHALRVAHFMYFRTGLSEQLRDSVARVVPHWQHRSLPLEGYLHGMYGFGLEETHIYDKAEREARLALDMNACDGWATHTMAHIHETHGAVDTGIQFLTSSADNWGKSSFIACHNYWHLALHHMHREDYNMALELYDKQIITSASRSRHMGDLVDASQLLFRLDLRDGTEDLGTGGRWERVYELVKPYVSARRRIGFCDIHILMTCASAGRWDTVDEIMAKIDGYEGDDQWLRTTRAIMDAVVAYKREQYAKCVERLLDVKYEMQCLGGSIAQREVFTKLLIRAALKSTVQWHRQLAINLVNEWEAFREAPTVL